MFYAISTQETEKNQILHFAHEKGFLIEKFINQSEIQIITASDTLITSDMTSIAGHFIKSLSQCILIAENGGKVIFVNDQNLSILDNSMFAVFKSILALEKKFISIRTKAGHKAAKAAGAKLGRPKGAANKMKVLDEHKTKIEDYLKKNISLRSVMKIINADLEKPVSYFTYRRYAESLCK
jgi:DNA invertase Pin-like site-specific DNA recombinase